MSDLEKILVNNSEPEYIDAHSHVQFAVFNEDREEVIDRALKSGVWMVNVGTNLETSKKAVELAEKYDKGVYAIVGLHPVHAIPSHYDEQEFGKNINVDGEVPDLKNSIKKGEVFDKLVFEELLKSPKVIGIGECGIDVFRIEDEVEKGKALKLQEIAFREQIELAIKYDKPIMIHARNSYRKILEILYEYFNNGNVRLRGDAHFFAGTVEEAKAFIDLGFKISFTGVITFASQYEEIIKYAPIESLLSETDCPYVSPIPHRGKRNEPVWVIEVVKKIAEIKGLDQEYVKKELKNNWFSLFGQNIA